MSCFSLKLVLDLGLGTLGFELGLQVQDVTTTVIQVYSVPSSAVLHSVRRI